MTIVFRFLALVIGYAFGLIQTSYILGRMKGVDIRELGSGNAGTTNALRNFGKAAGALVLFVDILKAVLAMALAAALFQTAYPDATLLPALYAGFGAMLGHSFPFYMNFRGGKGIACLFGVYLFTSWKMTLIAFLVFLIIFLTTHYVSLGSILAAVLFPIQILIFSLAGWLPGLQAHKGEAGFVALLIAALAVVQHRGNIQRLLAGEERRTRLK